MRNRRFKNSQTLEIKPILIKIQISHIAFALNERKAL